jgi:hypothetical protein
MGVPASTRQPAIQRQRQAADDALWDELAGFSSPVALIRGDWGGPLAAAADLAAPCQRVPQARVVTISGTGVLAVLASTRRLLGPHRRDIQLAWLRGRR